MEHRTKIRGGSRTAATSKMERCSSPSSASENGLNYSCRFELVQRAKYEEELFNAEVTMQSIYI